MNPDLQAFIEQARHRHLTNADIKQHLVAAGWDESEVTQALSQDKDELIVPAPPSRSVVSNATHPADPIQPISVVQNLSVKGFEYNMMFITLWLSALAAVWIINDFIYGSSASEGTFPLTILIVSLPIFLIIFVRLRRAEIANDSLRNDPSRRKSIQSTQRLAFIVLLVQTIGTLYALINHGSSINLDKVIISWIVSVAIFGGIFMYYWKSVQKDQLAQH